MNVLVNISNIDACRKQFNQQPNIVSLIIRVSRDKNLLEKIKSTSDEKDPSVMLINSTITLLYNLTCEEEILLSVKNSDHITGNFLDLAKNSRYNRIRLQAYQIVAVILDDDAIKKLNLTQLSASTITAEFLKFLQMAVKSPTQRYLGVHVS
ncbi:unnamed protein product [Rotaria sordida]|uniref:Uncharacterized protein n=1 Tax=Rotaria sordida TaxID=392033 RepID=A0A819WKE9_9BILA|nr:unnamed protein product [Rotaria sordida]CAF4125068.1 unnamed protein product [Rotaria sordida]